MIDDDQGRWRASVQRDDVAMGTLGILLGRALGDGRAEYLTGLGSSMTADNRVIREGYEAHPDLLHVPEPVARALYDALAEHFGHGAPGRQLRSDYDAERRRVDKLTDAVLAQLPGRPS